MMLVQFKTDINSYVHARRNDKELVRRARKLANKFSMMLMKNDRPRNEVERIRHIIQEAKHSSKRR